MLQQSGMPWIEIVTYLEVGVIVPNSEHWMRFSRLSV
jgi:hypothetical protein